MSMGVCDRCGGTFPLKKMQRRWEWEESTKAGGSWTYRVSGSSIRSKTNSSKGYNRKGGGLSYNTGRMYYRKRHFYVCHSCVAREEQQRKEMWKSIFSFVVLVGVVYGFFELWKYVEKLFQ